jgi:hypothetical protein
MYGGPSQVDTFDYKPKLYGSTARPSTSRPRAAAAARSQGRVVGPKWNFRQYGQCGKYVSDLFPHLARSVDDLAFVHSMYADSPLHGSAMLMMNSGRILSGAPCLGSWVTYGLGSENQNLPGFVVMLDQTGGPISGAKNWNSGYMPAVYQGTVLRPQGEPILDLALPSGMTAREQRRMLDALREQNEAHHAQRQRRQRSGGAHRTATSSPTACRRTRPKRSTSPPSRGDAAPVRPRRPAHRGLRPQVPARAPAGRARRALRADLLGRQPQRPQLGRARRPGDEPHEARRRHRQADRRPAADLKQRGLLESTIVVWGGEFGRQPTAEYAEGTGRDHDSAGFTMWLAGGGIRGGTSVGATDELGYRAVDKPFHVKHLHATILHQLGLDPNRLATSTRASTSGWSAPKGRSRSAT